MSSLLRSLMLVVLAGAVAAPFAAAEPPAPAPTADDVKALREKFQTERDQALKAKFPADALVRADDLAKRADEADKAKNYKAALRHLRDARWQLPYLPPGLPDHVSRVLGESRMRHADRVNAARVQPRRSVPRQRQSRRHGEGVGRGQRPRGRHLPRPRRPAGRPDQERHQPPSE